MSDAQLETEIKNHEDWRNSGKAYSKENAARYDDLLRARNDRAGWCFETSLRAIEASARRGEYLSYKDLADANGLNWTMKVRFGIGSHLWDLVRWAQGRGLPMISAIVVNKKHIKGGQMEAETLSGFVAAAKELGREVDDPEHFLTDEQEAVFAHFQGK